MTNFTKKIEFLGPKNDFFQKKLVIDSEFSEFCVILRSKK